MSQERFPLAPGKSEIDRGVDPKVAREIGYELPGDHEEAIASAENIYWPTEQERAIGRTGLQDVAETLHNANPPQPRRPE